jgi:hypothetical protein
MKDNIAQVELSEKEKKKDKEKNKKGGKATEKTI